VSEVHQIVAAAVVATTIALLFAASWSMVAARRSGGRQDHRFAVDRSLLVGVALIAANDVAGAIVVAGGAAPADPLHLVYGAAAFVTLPIGWLLGGRPRGGRPPTRIRRDAWVVAASVVLLGLELRLYMTG
jgi:hypothetical protein